MTDALQFDTCVRWYLPKNAAECIFLFQYTPSPTFSIYFTSSRNIKKVTRLTCPQQIKYKFNTSIYLPLMYITFKKSTANLKLVDNLIVSPDTSTQSTVSSAD
jgi:hypothetical protein